MTFARFALRFVFFCAFLFPLQDAQAAGRQLTGVYSPASTPPLPPDEAAKKMTLPEGFEARIFAHEPQVVNPVGMTWDERGRLWVVELYEYPLGAAPGTKPRDNIKILEDTDRDGRADKVTVFADGLNLATGILLGYGGVFVGQAPHLLFMEDTNGDDKADKTTILKTGFGLEDRHELLNSFTWGPDGQLYMTHGIFTHSKVKDLNDLTDDGVTMTGAVARYHPRTKKFEVFSEGTSNPWGVDFDRAGNAFVSACVIDHMFHMAPGGSYQRQAGSAPNPYQYEYLPSIVDHKHFRAAYAGIQVYQGDQYPDEYQGTILMGNIHDSAVHQDRLTPVGTTFKASFMKDFVRANDGWFRPVSTQVGPDGAVWIMDWYDKYPCYQNANADPEGVDRSHGRIWRIVYTGKEKGKAVPPHPAGMDLLKASTEELVNTLEHANVWQRRMAQRVLSERGERAFPLSLHGDNPLHALFKDGKTLEARLAALWTLHGMGLLDEGFLTKASIDPDPIIRSWVARLTGERGYPVEDAMDRLEKLSRDTNILVRASVAVAARQFVSSSLTVNTPPQIPVREVITGPILSGLWFASEGKHDPLFSFLYWNAVEPIIAYDAEHAVGFYQENGAVNHMPFSGIILGKIMRRICDLGDAGRLSRALLYLQKLGNDHAPAITAALKGVLEGQRGRPLIPNAEARALVNRFAALPDPAASSAAQQLGTAWGEASALESQLKVALDAGRPADERIQSIQSVRQQKKPAVQEALQKLLGTGVPESVSSAAIVALGDFTADDIADGLLGRWKEFSSANRRAAAQVLASRGKWAQRLISATENKTVALGDLPTTVVRGLLTSKDDYVRNRATAVIGKFRESSPDKAKLITEKKQMVLNGPVDLAKGHELAQKTCFTCHKLHGEGTDVGPDLTGSGRSSLDALLANIIDPNQLIGAGYENVEVTLKDERIVSGRMIENTESRVKILMLGGKEEVLAKADIDTLRVGELSVMPEGLEQLPDEDFRNLVWYILNPPQDSKAIYLLPGEKKLNVRAKPAGKEASVDLLSYSTDPSFRPYLHPVRDPGGTTVLTQDKPEDHPWQHGIFTGLHQVNGLDFWSEKEGRQKFVRLLDVVQEQDHVAWRSLTEWIAPSGEIVLEEEQLVKVHALTSADHYDIDFDWTLRAKDKAVKIGRHDYGGFSVRPDFLPAHTHLNANGDRDAATAEKRAAWCNVARDFGGKTFGLVVYDHPANPGAPAKWRVDSFGFINPSPSLQGDWEIAPGGERTYHYRVSPHAGPGDAAVFDTAFKDYSKVAFNQVAAKMTDRESVALWNPEWQLIAPDYQDTPMKLPEFHGRKNVLMTHPFDEKKGSALERALDVPAGQRSTLTFAAAAHDQGDWELRVLADGQLLKKQVINKDGDRWKTISVDLTAFAGKKVKLRLENAANNWSWEFGYWSDIKLGTL